MGKILSDPASSPLRKGGGLGATAAAAVGAERVTGPAPDTWLREELEKIQKLRLLPAGWDGYEAPPPNEAATRRAEEVLHVLDERDRRPHRVAASAEGGILIAFRNGERYGDIECDNDGDVVIVTSDGHGAVDARSEPSDALLPDWADWGVAAFAVMDVPPSLPSEGGPDVEFKVEHVPLEENYVHSEVGAYKLGKHSRDLGVPKTVKSRFRQILSEKSHIVIEPQA